MEFENDEQLPFYIFFVFQKPNWSLERQIFRKPTQTDLSLNGNRIRCPFQKCGVFSTLVLQATISSDKAHFLQMM